MGLKSVFITFLFLILSSVNTYSSTEPFLEIPSKQNFKEFSKSIHQGNFTKALHQIKSKIKNLSPEDQKLAYFTAGVLNAKYKKYDEALKNLSKVENVNLLKTYVNYYQGYAHFGKQDFKLAEIYFKKAIADKHIQRKMRDEVRFLLGQVNLHFRQSHNAYKNLNPLVRRWRGSERRAELLDILLTASLKNKMFSSSRYCKWFKKLYTDHPFNEHSKSWGFKSEDLAFKGEKLACEIKYQHQKAKLRKYYLEGLNQEIVKNLVEVDSNKVVFKKLKASYYYYTGEPKKALKLMNEVLAQAQKSEKDHYKNKLSQAKYASLSGDPDQALSIYSELYKKEKSVYKRSWLLNTQASLNMNLSRFTEAQKFYKNLVSNFRGYSYGRKAEWGLAWSYYLNGQNQEALNGFQKLLKLHKRNSRRYSFVEPGQLKYWSARVLQKIKKESEAVRVFKEVSEDPVVSYYAILSALRLEELAKAKGLSLNKDDFLNRPWVPKSPSLKTQVADFLSSYDFDERQPASLVVESKGLKVLKSKSHKTSKKQSQSFNEAEAYQDSFLRHAYFKKLGFHEEAREELKVIKKYAKTKGLKTRLLEHFREVRDFSSLARLSALSFDKERYFKSNKTSFEFWAKSYPMAFKDEVKYAAQKFNVSTSLVWALMRAESFFDPKILSPVGARGLLQMMPYTASRVSTLMQTDAVGKDGGVFLKDQNLLSDSLLEPRINIQYGARYINRLSKQFKDHLPFIAAAYNGGPHRVKLWSSRFGKIPQDEFTERVPFKETRGYIKKVMRNMYVYSSLYGIGADVSHLIAPTGYTHKGPVPAAEYWGEI